MTNKSSIRTMSIGKAVRGAHPDIVILDDILSVGRDATKSISTWFYTALLLSSTTRLNSRGGDTFSFTDLYAELRGPESAVNSACNQQATGEPLWLSDGISMRSTREGEMTSIAFTRGYLYSR